MAKGSALRQGLVYLGLADDGLSEVEAPMAPPTERRATQREYAPAPQAVFTPEQPSIAEVTPIRAAQHYQAPAAPAQPDLRRITTVHPRSYNDARLIGEAFRSGTPVIMNLSDMSDDDAKRLVDFSSGLIFGLHGGIERVTGKVFLLSPEHIEVIGEEEIAAAEAVGGQFYNQS